MSQRKLIIVYPLPKFSKNALKEYPKIYGGIANERIKEYLKKLTPTKL